MNAKTKLLKQVPLALCSRGELEEIGRIADEIDFKEGKQLAREGAAGREFFVIETARPRSHAAAGSSGRSATVTSSVRSRSSRSSRGRRSHDRPVRALVITDRSFRRMLDASPTIQRRFSRRSASASARPGSSAYIRRREKRDTHTIMATTATERKLFVGGDWVETGDWIDVRSPYSGEVVGRVAKGGAKEAQRAIDAAERRSAARCPRTSAPRSSSRSRATSAAATRRSRGRSPTRPASR